MTRKLLLTVAALSLLTIAGALQAIPQDEHKNQPKACDNVSDNPHKCDCERAEHECDPNNQYASQKCKTYCRPEACKCANPCNSD